MEGNRPSEDQFPVSENETSNLDVPNQQSNLEKGIKHSEIGPNYPRESEPTNDITTDNLKNDDSVYGSQASDDKETLFTSTEKKSDPEFIADEGDKTISEPQKMEYTAHTGSDNQTVPRDEYNNLTPENEEDEDAINENHHQNESAVTKSARILVEKDEKGGWVNVSVKDKTELSGEIKQKTENMSKHTQEDVGAMEPDISEETKSITESNAAGQECLKQSLDENKSSDFSSKDGARLDLDGHDSEEGQAYKFHNNLDESGPHSPTTDSKKIETETPLSEQKCGNCLTLEDCRAELNRVSDENARLEKTQKDNEEMIQSLVHANEQTTGHVNGLKVENDSYMKRIDNLMNENDQNIKRINSMKSENDRYRKHIDNLDGQITNLKKEIERKEANYKKTHDATIRKFEEKLAHQDRQYAKEQEEKEAKYKKTHDTTVRKYEEKIAQQEGQYKQYAKEQEEYWEAVKRSLEGKNREQEKKHGNLLLRYSKLAGDSLTIGNANVTDLSDPQRPTKLAEQFSELYDNEWTDAFEETADMDDNEKIKFLLNILQRAYDLSIEITSAEWLSRYNYTTYGNYTDTGTDACWKDFEQTNRESTEDKLSQLNKHALTEEDFLQQNSHKPTDKDFLQPNKHEPTDKDLLQPDKHEVTDKDLLKPNIHEPTDEDVLQQNKNELTEENLLQENSIEPTDEDLSQPNEHGPTDKDLLQPTIHEQTNKDLLQPNKHEPTNKDLLQPNKHEPTDKDLLQPNKHETPNKDLLKPNTHGSADEDVLQPTKHEQTDKDLAQINIHEQTDKDALKPNKHEPTEDLLQTKKHEQTEVELLQEKNHETTEFLEQNNHEPAEKDLLHTKNHEPTVELLQQNNHKPTKEDSLQAKNHESTGEAIEENLLQQNMHVSTVVDLSTSVDPEKKVSCEGTSVDPDVATTGSKNNITRREVIHCIEVPDKISKSESENKAIKMFIHTRKKVLSKASSDIQKVITRCLQEELQISFKEDTAIIRYINKCTELCLLMGLKDPPLFIDFMKSDPTEKYIFTPDRFKAYTKKGKYIDFLVWPCLYLEEGGERALLSKGIAQGTN